MTAQFRIGGVYRTQGGAAVELFGLGKEWGDGRVQVLNGINLNGHKGSNNGQWLVNGTYYNGPGRREAMRLLPGELHNVNGQWVPVAEEAPKTSLQLSAPLCGSLQHAEKVRPELTWATPKPVDRWDGYVVKSGKYLGSGPNEFMGSSPLQRMTDPSDPLHGSAFLR